MHKAVSFPIPFQCFIFHTNILLSHSGLKRGPSLVEGTTENKKTWFII